MRRVLLVAALSIFFPLLISGCKQGIGDRCQVNSDCDDGLLCILPAGGTPQAGGTCQPPGGDAGALPVDFAVEAPDLATVD